MWCLEGPHRANTLQLIDYLSSSENINLTSRPFPFLTYSSFLKQDISKPLFLTHYNFSTVYTVLYTENKSIVGKWPSESPAHLNFKVIYLLMHAYTFLNINYDEFYSV